MAEQFTIFRAFFSPDDSLWCLINHNDFTCSCWAGDLDGNLVTSSKIQAASLATLVTTWRAAKPIKVNTVFLKMLSCM